MVLCQLLVQGDGDMFLTVAVETLPTGGAGGGGLQEESAGQCALPVFDISSAF